MTPRSGCDPCAAVPCAVAVIHAPPRSASPTARSLGSPTIAAPCVRSPRSHSTWVPWIPASSSSAARWKVTRPGPSIPARRTAAAAASAAAIGPFMSHAPRPIRRPSITSPANGSAVHVSRDPAGTVSRCPFQASVGPSPSPIVATTLGRPAAPRTTSGTAPSPSSTPAATAAASSSVPPGFSERAASRERATARTSSASTASAARFGSVGIGRGRYHPISGTRSLVARRARTMERCSISPPPSPRTWRPIHGLSRRRAIASRRCSRS